MDYRDVPITPFAQWFDANLHTAQYLRILRSGLKPEPGAWERSKFKMELAAREWGPTPEMQMERGIAIVKARRINAVAKIGMPKRRPKAHSFRPVTD